MKLTTFEQPTSEICRVLLRLEYLFQEMSRYSERTEDLSVAMKFLAEVITVLDRPDLKSKLTQELHRFIAIFSKFSHNPDIDSEKLQDTLKSLRQALEYVGTLQGKLCQSLRDHEFLNGFRIRMHTPAGICGFEFPLYQQWLSQNPTEALRQYTAWCASLNPVRELTQLLLTLIRDGTEYKRVMAEQGFYQEILQNQNGQLLRLQYSTELNLYPEISVGKHRLIIRFYVARIDERSTQTTEDVPFDLACCCI